MSGRFPIRAHAHFDTFHASRDGSHDTLAESRVKRAPTYKDLLISQLSCFSRASTVDVLVCTIRAVTISAHHDDLTSSRILSRPRPVHASYAESVTRHCPQSGGFHVTTRNTTGRSLATTSATSRVSITLPVSRHALRVRAQRMFPADSNRHLRGAQRPVQPRPHPHWSGHAFTRRVQQRTSHSF